VKESATAAEEISAIASALEASVQPYVRVVSTPTGQPLALWASKACDGRPYLPKTCQWPERDLRPVMQFDLSELPELPHFPRKGLLSLWWTDDHQTSQLLYFADVIRDETQLWHDFSSVGHDTLYPYREPVSLAFERREGSVCWGDYRFEGVLGEEVVEALYESPHYSEVYDYVSRSSGGADTRIGGWANPQQEDPRTDTRWAAYETQLLQIQNDNFTHNIFIKPAALERADFSDVLFFGACD